MEKDEILVHRGSIDQHKADSGTEMLAFDTVYDEKLIEVGKMGEFGEPYGKSRLMGFARDRPVKSCRDVAHLIAR